MTRKRFRHLLRDRGADLRRWPTMEREAALALLRRSPSSRAWLAEALDAEPAPTDDPELTERLRSGLHRRTLAARPPVPAVRGPVPVLRWRTLRWAALGACFVAGIWLGHNGPQPVQMAALDTSPGGPLAAVQFIPLSEEEP